MAIDESAGDGEIDLREIFAENLFRRRPRAARVAVRPPPGEGPEDQPAQPVENARQPQLGEKRVDAIGGFADVLDEQDSLLERRHVRRAEQPDDGGQVAAQQGAFGDAFAERAEAFSGRAGEGVASFSPGDRPELRFRGRVEVGPVDGDHGTRNARRSGAAPQGEMQGGYVAVSDKQLGMGFRRRVIEMRQQAEATVSAPRGDQHVYVVPPQESVQFVKPLGVGSGKVSFFREGGSADFHPIAPALQLRDARPQPGHAVRGAGRRDDADRIARFEGEGFHAAEIKASDGKRRASRVPAWIRTGRIRITRGFFPGILSFFFRVNFRIFAR